MSILRISHLALSLGGQQILDGINFEVAEGEVIGVIGPNGSGKTTLFNILSGFLKPTHGNIYFYDKDITNLSASERARIGIGRVFQNFGIFREMTLEENVLVALDAGLLGPLRLILFGVILLGVVYWRRDVLFPKPRSI